jgi:hypothetical protein
MFQFDPAPIAYIQKTLTSPFKFRLLMLKQIPMNYLAGVRIKSLTDSRCEVTLKHRWLVQNPFRSTFWAVLGMAAEMASGAMVMMYTYKQKPSISMLVGQMGGKFTKKAVGKTTFMCEIGQEIKAAVAKAAETGEAVEIVCPTKGFNAAGEQICEFSFTWTMKARSK